MKLIVVLVTLGSIIPCTELVMDNRPLVGPMGQAYLKSDEYGKTPIANQIVP